MGGLNPFAKPKQDRSAIDAQRKRIEEQEAAQARKEQELEEERRRREQATLSARRGRSGSSRSLLRGPETGVQPERRETIG